MYYQNYYENLKEVLEQIFTQENEKIRQAGAMLAETLEKDGLLYVFGSGHSHILAEELFYRAGGLLSVYPIFDTVTMLHEGAAKSSQVERMSGYAQHLIDRYPIGPNDILLLSSNSGINPLCMEMAEIASQKGAKVIGISSLAYLDKPSRHKDGKHLPDFCDICLDNHVPVGDATIQVCEDGTKAGPVSTVAILSIAHAMVLEACEIMNSHGVQPKVFRSANCPGNDAYNAVMLKEFSSRIRCL